MDKLYKAVEMIGEQQAALKQKNQIYWVGEQLKDILRAAPGAAGVVMEDLRQSGMTITDCEKKIAAYAKGNGGCCPPQEADKIIREFYGINNISTKEVSCGPKNGVIALEEFLL